MAQDARLDRFQLFTGTALIAAHASTTEAGFRHRDVLFFIDLFSNWVEWSLRDEQSPIQNSQIKRHLEELIAEGYARKISRKGYPRYRLTRIGLLEVISRCVHRSYLDAHEHFFFLTYFLTSYQPRLEKLVAEEGRQFPIGLRLELQELLNVDSLIDRERRVVNKVLQSLEIRITDSERAATHALKADKQGALLERTVSEIEKLYPYELNSQKPLSELIFGLPADQRWWELKIGNRRRGVLLWKTAKRRLLHYRKELESLSESIANLA